MINKHFFSVLILFFGSSVYCQSSNVNLNNILFNKNEFNKVLFSDNEEGINSVLFIF